MRYVLVLTLTAAALAQTPAPPAAAPGQALLSQKNTEELATRMLQLMESTAFAVPGLTRASEPVKQNAELTATAMQRTPLNAALTYQFINHVKAYLALSGSIPRPYPFPQTADQQYAELRESLQRMQQHFEGLLLAENRTETNRNADPNQTARYSAANAKLPPPGKTPRVVFIGDSITDYWRLNEYFPGQDFLNRGIAGQTTTQVLARFLQDVVNLHPKGVVVLAGINDLRGGIPLTQIEDNLTAVGDIAKEHAIKPAFGSIMPVGQPNANLQPLNKWLADYCRAEGFVYIDYYSALVDSTGKIQADTSDDGLHPNSKGYRIMSPLVQDAVTKITGPDTADAQKRGRFKLLGK